MHARSALAHGVDLHVLLATDEMTLLAQSRLQAARMTSKSLRRPSVTLSTERCRSPSCTAQLRQRQLASNNCDVKVSSLYQLKKGSKSRFVDLFLRGSGPTLIIRDNTWQLLLTSCRWPEDTCQPTNIVICFTCEVKIAFIIARKEIV